MMLLLPLWSFLLTSTWSSSVSAKSRSLRLITNGWLPLNALLPPRLATEVWLPAVAGCVAKHEQVCTRCSAAARNDITNAGCHGCLGSVGGSRSFIRANDVHRRCAPLRRLLLESDEGDALARLAADLLSTERVRLYKSTAFFKAEGDVESSWHQDHAAVPLATNGRFVTLWIALDAIIDAAQGPLRFARTSHLKTTNASISLQTLPLSRRIAWMRRLADGDVVAACPACVIESAALPMAAGDGTAHLGYTLHSARGHSAGVARPRRALALSFVADGVALERELFATQRGAKGVALTADDGTKTVVQLIADDTSTWLPWLLEKEMVAPPAPMRSERFLPLFEWSGVGSASASGEGARRQREALRRNARAERRKTEREKTRSKEKKRKQKGTRARKKRRKRMAREL